MLQNRLISPYVEYFGKYDDNQAPNTYSHYSDIVMETLLSKLHSKMEKNTGLKLYPNYSYARIYKNGDILERHKDRMSCEISTTHRIHGERRSACEAARDGAGAGDISNSIATGWSVGRVSPTQRPRRLACRRLCVGAHAVRASRCAYACVGARVGARVGKGGMWDGVGACVGGCAHTSLSSSSRML